MFHGVVPRLMALCRVAETNYEPLQDALAKLRKETLLTL
jgi:hypothetical protein